MFDWPPSSKFPRARFHGLRYNKNYGNEDFFSFEESISGIAQ